MVGAWYFSRVKATSNHTRDNYQLTNQLASQLNFLWHWRSHVSISKCMAEISPRGMKLALVLTVHRFHYFFSPLLLNQLQIWT